MTALLVARLLRDPSQALELNDEEWTAALSAGRAERLLGSLEHRLSGLVLPPHVAQVLGGARADAEAGRTQALWEAEMARRALAPLGVPVVLLKGTAFVAAGLDAGQGRLIGDLDILVPQGRLDDVEAALLRAGWEWVKPDAYDDAYYRRWMHELPPLIHRDRDRMIDVHHTILPPTARPTPDAAALIGDSVALGVGQHGGLRVLSPEDMIVHASAHLFADGDLSGGLRNLWDIDRLLREFDGEGFVDRLRARARRHGLERHVDLALRLRAHLFVEDIPLSGRDKLFIDRLLARDGWGRATRLFLRFGFYVRSHLLRMPLPLLARHLTIKALRRPS